MVVGPKFHQVKDVSPIVNVAGYSFRDSDETDHTGFEITSCNWDSVAEAETGLERVRLKVRARMCGGEQSSLTILSYLSSWSVQFSQLLDKEFLTQAKLPTRLRAPYERHWLSLVRSQATLSALVHTGIR